MRKKSEPNPMNPKISPTDYERRIGDIIEQGFTSEYWDLQSLFKHTIENTEILRALAGLRPPRTIPQNKIQRWEGASGCAHQIDESFAMADKSAILLVECKHWGRRIDVRAFSRFLVAVVDIAEAKQYRTVLGMIATTQGTQGKAGTKEKDLGCIEKLRIQFEEMGYHIIFQQVPDKIDSA